MKSNDFFILFTYLQIIDNIIKKGYNIIIVFIIIKMFGVLTYADHKIQGERYCRIKKATPMREQAIQNSPCRK